MKKRHFSTTHHHHHHRPPQHHRLPPPPPPYHPYTHHHQAQPINHQAQAQAQPNYPSYETTLTQEDQEVLYLHSLWRRGPPTHSSYGPTTTHFKKYKPTPPCQVSDKEWPVPEVGPVSDSGSGSGWAAFPTLNTPITRPATVEELARVIGVRIQMRGVDACSCLFRKRARNEDEDEEEDEEEEDDGDDEEEIDLFENLFEEDEELRGFYKKNCEGRGGGGEFCCLVCGSGNVGRKFKNCVALVQHSITVSKTKRRKAHRAYGRVVCKVLGWDVDRLPSLSVSGGDGVGVGVEVGGLESVGKPSEVMKGEVNNDADGGCVEMERNAALAETSQTEMETIPDALETENPTNTGVGCTAAEITPGLDEVKNDAGGGFAGVEMERNVALAEPSQTETKTILDALVTENITSTGVGCTAVELTPGLDDVKSHGDEDSTVVEMERDASLVKSNQTGMETIPDSLEKENVTSTDAGCIANELTHGLQRNDAELDQEAAVNKNEEGCPVLESKLVESESSVAEDDPFEQLPCLPGAFQIPE